MTVDDDSHERIHERAIYSGWPAAEEVAVVVVVAVETPQVALMAVRTPAVVAAQPEAEGRSLAAVLLAVAEPEQPVPRTGAVEPAAVVAAVAAAGKWL
jgi:hypothetical protein